MSIVIENASALPVAITDGATLAVGIEEDDLPSLGACAVVLAKQEHFARNIDWAGSGEDTERIIVKDDKVIVITIHREVETSGADYEDLDVVIPGR